MDLARFLNVVLNGGLFQKSGTLDEMLAFVDVPDAVSGFRHITGYGLGIMKFLLPGNIEMLGHAGGTAGFSSFIYFLPKQEMTVSGMMSNMVSDQYQILSPALEILIPEFVSKR
jgi:CubicO group peptidase (beta-lactamase class C family)